MYLKTKVKNIEIVYRWRLNGGGLIFCYEFVHLVAEKIGKVDHVFEYCAGPGFIGFSLLANNLCERLTLADVNPEAVEVIAETIKANNLQDRVTVYQSDCLDAIPVTEQWDLVVGNPPWWLCPKGWRDIRVCDPQGRVHEKFYQDIRKFLKPRGSIFFIEGGEYTKAGRFEEMITKNGLQRVGTFHVRFLWDVFRKRKEYRGLNPALIVFLRFCLFCRRAYFIWVKRVE